MTRDLSTEEIEELSESAASGIMLPTDGGETQEYTEAELALLEQEEGFVVDVDETSFENVSGTMKRMLSTPQGRPLKVEMLDNAVSSDTVNLYDSLTGQPYPIARANIRFYLDKVHDDGSKVFSTRPKVKLPARPYECPAAMCLGMTKKKTFSTVIQRDEHFRNRHHAEWARTIETREADEREEARLMNRNLAGVLTMLASGKADLSEADVAAIAKANQSMGAGLTPDVSWPRSRILGWMESKGIPYTNERAGLHTRDLLVSIGAVDAEEVGLEPVAPAAPLSASEALAEVVKRGPGRPRREPEVVGA